MKLKHFSLAVAGIAAAAISLSAAAQKKYDTGATDKEIKIGDTKPVLGPGVGLRHASARRSRRTSTRSTPKAASTAARSSSSRSTTATTRPRRSSRRASWSRKTRCCSCSTRWARRRTRAIQKYMNTKKVPQLFVATGATKWGDPKNFPWTMGWQPNYQTEGKIYAAHILETKPNAKIGVLYQNDDYGKDYLKGFEDGLGDKAKTMIVAKVSLRGHRPHGRQPDGHAQGLGRRHLLQRHDAQVRRAGDQEGGRDRLEADALPQQRVGIGRLGADAGGPGEQRSASSPRPTCKDPTDPQWANDKGMQDWKAWMAKYYPSGDVKDASNVYGYTRGADGGAGAQAVRRQPDARKRDEAGRQPRHDAADCCCRASTSRPARTTSIRSSASSWRASTARPGSCSARCTTRAVTDRLVRMAKAARRIRRAAFLSPDLSGCHRRRTQVRVAIVHIAATRRAIPFGACSSADTPSHCSRSASSA